MPGRRCVVQDCGNVKNDELGISVHNSPDSGSVRLKVEKVRVHSSEGFQPSGKICCVIGAFYKGLFYACFSDERHEKEFEEGTFPTIWKKSSQTLSKRSRRSVSEITMYLRSCAYHHYIYFPIYL